MNEQATTLVSEQICVAFPIACVIAFVVVTTIWFAWRALIDQVHFQRFCRVCGGRASALRVIDAAEKIDIMGAARK